MYQNARIYTYNCVCAQHLYIYVAWKWMKRVWHCRFFLKWTYHRWLIYTLRSCRVYRIIYTAKYQLVKIFRKFMYCWAVASAKVNNSLYCLICGHIYKYVKVIIVYSKRKSASRVFSRVLQRELVYLFC